MTRRWTRDQLARRVTMEEAASLMGVTVRRLNQLLQGESWKTLYNWFPGRYGGKKRHYFHQNELLSWLRDSNKELTKLENNRK